ncbi:MAG: hypothetical protein DSM106950_40150 [Stigonema ocellatum SAG 48.90 = DSM 106950]|nr:hypothetical protein [Stigonema ocellatum SAG 48.90 = DSM 106950]
MAIAHTDRLLPSLRSHSAQCQRRSRCYARFIAPNLQLIVVVLLPF